MQFALTPPSNYNTGEAELSIHVYGVTITSFCLS